MREILLHDTELRVMNILWENGKIPAIQVAKILADEFGYKKTTTYTLIKRCIDKGYVNRINPGFVCEAIITKNQVQHSEVKNLVDKIYDGNMDSLVLSVMENMIDKEEIKRIKRIVLEWEDDN